MSEFFSRLPGHDIVAVVAVVGGLLIAAIAIVVNNWRRVRIAEMEGALKQQMLEKGMAAGDIEQVLRASKETRGPCAHSGSPAPDRSTLVHAMAENGYSGEDIERILHAFDASGSHGGCGSHSEAILREKAAIAHNLVENGMEAADIERVLLAIGSKSGHPVA